MQLIESLLKHLHDHHVLPEVATRVEEYIGPRIGEYAAIADGQELSRRLTADLQAIDKSLAVGYSADPFPPQGKPEEPNAEQLKARDLGIVLDNAGFHRVERLPGNVGYLELTRFVQPEVGGETAAAAMAFLAGTEALIVDLRTNRGGSPFMVSLLCSYFVQSQTHLVTFVWRDRTHQIWTLPHVPGRRYLDKPLYVLTSRQTFSAAEEFSYDLKNLKRATIVGEPTSGDVHRGRRYQLDDHFEAFIPGARFMSAITGSNWEGTGVLPDISVPAEQALKVAYAEALGQVIAKSEKEPLAPWRQLRQEAQKALSELA